MQYIDTVEIPVKIRLLSPKSVGVGMLGFSVGIVRDDTVIYRTSGWRVGRGRVQVPSMKTGSGYIPTAIITEKFLKLITLMLVENWGGIYRDVEFPEIPVTEEATEASK